MALGMSSIHGLRPRALRTRSSTGTISQHVNLNFQIRLNEGSQVIEAAYGDCSPGVATTTTRFQVGLRGPVGGYQHVPPQLVVGHRSGHDQRATPVVLTQDPVHCVAGCGGHHGHAAGAASRQRGQPGPQAAIVEGLHQHAGGVLAFQNPLVEGFTHPQAVPGVVFGVLHPPRPVAVTEQRRIDEERRFMAEASRELVASLDYEQTLKRVTELAVRHVWVFLFEEMREDLRVRRGRERVSAGLEGGAERWSYPGLTDEPLSPGEAKWVESNGAHLALLMYDDMRKARDPRNSVLEFLESAYEAGAKRAGWDIEEFRPSYVTATKA